MLNFSSSQFEKLLATAQARLNARQLPDAEQFIRQALAINPGHPAAQHILGVIFLLTQRKAEAIAAFQQVIATKPTAEAYLNLVQLFHFTGRADESLAMARQADAKYPNDPRVVRELGRVLEKQGHYDEALRRYRQASTRWGKDPILMQQYGSLLFFQGQVAEAVAVYQQAVAANPQHAGLHSALLYTLHFMPCMGAVELLREHREWNRRHAQPLAKEIQPWPNTKQPDRRLRIGYVSSNFKMHSVGRFIAPLLAQHDHAQFQIFAYSDVHTADPLTHRLQKAVDVYRPCFGLSDAHVAQQIRADGIDILVDLTMHMPSNRLPVFARKPAPVQVTYLAYAGTTGLSAMDYRISDTHLDPPGHDHVYSEKTLRLPSYWCYEPPPEAPEVLRAQGESQHRLTFGCLNNLAKVSPEALETWAQILAALPDSKLLLHCVEGETRATMLEQLSKAGITADRVHFAGRVPLDQFLQFHQQIDIALDPFPYGGGTTTCDALWMGVPVITLNDTAPHALAVGRGGASILHQLNLQDLVATTRDQYVHLAVALAQDPARRTHLRQTLRQTMLSSPLTKAPAFARSMENAYREIWRQYCQ